MLMQMLRAGGFPVLTDDVRLADERNPNGYLEFEPAKRLVNDSTWLAAARGQAVKLVSPLLPHLPVGKTGPTGPTAPKYRIIHLHRPVSEIVASQRAMLARSGEAGGKLPDEALARIYSPQIAATRTLLGHWQYRGEAMVLEIAYHDALADPLRVAQKLATLLGPGFDPVAASAAVNPALRRQR